MDYVFGYVLYKSMAIQENRSHLVFQRGGVSYKGIALLVMSQTTHAGAKRVTEQQGAFT